MSSYVEQRDITFPTRIAMNRSKKCLRENSISAIHCLISTVVEPLLRNFLKMSCLNRRKTTKSSTTRCAILCNDANSIILIIGSVTMRFCAYWSGFREYFPQRSKPNLLLFFDHNIFIFCFIIIISPIIKREKSLKI